MAPSKIDKKRKDKDKNASKSDTEESLKTRNKNLCCVPKDTVVCLNPEILDWNNVNKVICNSSKCNQSGYMHAECFSKYEDALVSFMSKSGRGRTWNDKQRYGNMWRTCGYDIVFKKCGCDCGHGYLKKDLDFVPEISANNNEAGAAGGGGGAPTADKKKKKEKANLKPKLNFNPHSVTGPYFGSKRQKEEEEEYHFRKLQRQSIERNRSISVSSDKSEHSSSIPGLVVPVSFPVPVPVNPVLKRKKSESPEAGWVKVSNSRRGSQCSGGSSRPASPGGGLDLIEKLRRDEKSSSDGPPVQQLPMFQAPTVQKPLTEPSQSTQSLSDFSLTGTRPKLSPGLSGLPVLPTIINKEDDCIYHSDEDIPFGDDKVNLVGLSPIGTPIWSDIESSASNQDRDQMEALHELTKSFAKEVNSQCRVSKESQSSQLEDSRHGIQHIPLSSQAKLSQDIIELSDLSGGWETLSTGPIQRPKPELEDCKEELRSVKEDLEEERKQRKKIVEENEHLQELLKVEREAKIKLDVTVQTLEKESMTKALAEKTKWEKQIAHEVDELSSIISLLNKEVKDLREDQTKTKQMAVEEAKNDQVVRALEGKMEATLAAERRETGDVSLSLVAEVERSRRVAAEKELAVTKEKLNSMSVAMSELKKETVKHRSTQAQDEVVRLVLEEAKQRLGYTDEDLEAAGEMESASLLVSGLSPHTPLEAVAGLFSQHGTVASAALLGHITMSSSKEAASCLQLLHQTDLGGNKISVEISDLNNSQHDKLKQDEKRFLKRLKKKVNEDKFEHSQLEDNFVDKIVVAELFDEVIVDADNQNECEENNLSLSVESFESGFVKHLIRSFWDDTMDSDPQKGDHHDMRERLLGNSLEPHSDIINTDENVLDTKSSYVGDPQEDEEVKNVFSDELENMEDQITDNDASSILSDSPGPDHSEGEGESDSFTTGDEDGTPHTGHRDKATESKMAAMEENIVSLQRLVSSLASQMVSLTSKVEDYNFENGLLSRTMEIQQTKTSKMSETIEDLQGKNLALEKSLAQFAPVPAIESEVTGLKESFMEILDSCENFQESFNSMEKKQAQMDEKLESLEESFNTAKLDNSEMREELAKMGEKLSSLNLEFQVDKGQSKVQMDNLAYNLALLESKIPSESFSSTSGVKSAELSDTEDLHAEAKETSSSSKSLTKLPLSKKVTTSQASRTFQAPTSTSYPFLAHSQPRLPLLPRIAGQTQYFQLLPSQPAAYLQAFPNQGIFYR